MHTKGIRCDGFYEGLAEHILWERRTQRNDFRVDKLTPKEDKVMERYVQCIKEVLQTYYKKNPEEFTLKRLHNVLYNTSVLDLMPIEYRLRNLVTRWLQETYEE